MRQAGILAAGALYALENHVERLAEDHANARLLADAVRGIEGLGLVGDAVDTNIVIFQVDPAIGTAESLCKRLAEEGLLMLAIAAQQVRAVTHLDVDRAATTRAAEILAQVASSGGRPRSGSQRKVAYG
jgi:threonine aldolase